MTSSVLLFILTVSLLAGKMTSFSDDVSSAGSYSQFVVSSSGAATQSGELGDGSRLSAPVFTGESANVSRLLEQLLGGYDKRLRPNYKGDPVEVGITMFVSSVSAVSEVNMDFTVDFYFRQHWEDSRLKFGEGEGRQTAGNDSDTGTGSVPGGAEEELCISNEMLDKIWWPDTFFANAKSARFHTATTKNAFVRIKPNGLITQSLRLTVTAMCSMDLVFFPMDTQKCSLEIESYAYSVKHIAYNWKNGYNGSVTLATDLQLPQFLVRGYRVKQKLEVLSTGNYSRLACEFVLDRSIGYYLLQIYIPSTLIVILSWLSFWLHRDAAPARVALGITTVLTMTTLISSTNSSLPKISYLKSIDVYLVTCFVMVFSAILEYAAVSYIGNSKPRWIRVDMPTKQPAESTARRKTAQRRQASKMDVWNRERINMRQPSTTHPVGSQRSIARPYISNAKYSPLWVPRDDSNCDVIEVMTPDVSVEYKSRLDLNSRPGLPFEKRSFVDEHYDDDDDDAADFDYSRRYSFDLEERYTAAPSQTNNSILRRNRVREYKLFGQKRRHCCHASSFLLPSACSCCYLPSPPSPPLSRPSFNSLLPPPVIDIPPSFPVSLLPPQSVWTPQPSSDSIRRRKVSATEQRMSYNTRMDHGVSRGQFAEGSNHPCHSAFDHTHTKYNHVLDDNQINDGAGVRDLDLNKALTSSHAVSSANVLDLRTTTNSTGLEVDHKSDSNVLRVPLDNSSTVVRTDGRAREYIPRGGNPAGDRVVGGQRADPGGDRTQHGGPHLKNKNIVVATAIDRYSRVCFPLTFTALSVVYWVVYLNIRPSFTSDADDFVLFRPKHFDN